MRDSLVIKKGHFDFLPLMVWAVVCCDKLKTGIVLPRKSLGRLPLTQAHYQVLLLDLRLL